MCLRFKLRTSSLPKALFYLLIPFQSPMCSAVLSITISHSQNSCGLFLSYTWHALPYLPALLLPSFEAGPEIPPHHVVTIQLPLSRVFLARSKKGWWVRPSTRATAERTLQGGRSYQNFLDWSAITRACGETLWAIKENQYTGVCDWMLQWVLHRKDGLKFLPFTLWLIEKELRGGSESLIMRLLRFLIKLLRKKRSLWFVVWYNPVLLQC